MPEVGQLNPSPRLLLGPGPSDVHPRVLSVMTTPLMGHLDPQFLGVMNDVQAMLRDAYQTKNPMTLSIPATGMAGMEALLFNLLEPGDKLLACVKGFFGTRIVEVGQRTSAEVIRLDVPWGQAFDLDIEFERPIPDRHKGTRGWVFLEKARVDFVDRAVVVAVRVDVHHAHFVE